MKLHLHNHDGKEIVIEITGSLIDRGTPGFDIPGIANTVRKKQYACTPNIALDIEKIKGSVGNLSDSDSGVPRQVRVQDFRNGQLILEAMD